MKHNSFITCLFAGLSLLNGACDGNRTKSADIPNVLLVEVRNATTASVQEYPGRVKAAEEVGLAFKVSGTLANVFVEEGGRVVKGQPIAELDARDYRTQLDAVEAEYLKVKAEADRIMALYADSVSTADAYDKARYGLRQITAKYENAKHQLSDTKIYAPFDGAIQQRLFDTPTVIAAGMPVVTMVADGEREIEINIPASAYIRRDKMRSFSASFDFLPDRRIPLRLTGIAPKANANQLYSVRLAIPRDISPQPSPGMTAMVDVVISDTANPQTEIPSSALFGREDCSCVWVYDEHGGTVSLRSVSVERLHTDGRAIISQGLSAGERVVAVGVHKLREGQQIRPMTATSETNTGGLL
ncbi:MAG: efflux RND transporter periplasmic adaptor subunit [Alistipes sp.]